jgi:hypothetical protein
LSRPNAEVEDLLHALVGLGLPLVEAHHGVGLQLAQAAVHARSTIAAR